MKEINLKHLLSVAIINQRSINSLRLKISEAQKDIDDLQDEINDTLSLLDDDAGIIIRMGNIHDKSTDSYLCKRSGITKVNDLGVSNHDSHRTNNK